MSEQELKPCPFCGGEAYLLEGEPSTANFNEGAVHFAVACGTLGCQVLPKANLWQMNEDDAVNAWNTRPSMQDCAEEISKTLEEALAMIMSGDKISYSGKRLFCDLAEQILTKARGEN